MLLLASILGGIGSLAAYIRHILAPFTPSYVHCYCLLRFLVGFNMGSSFRGVHRDVCVGHLMNTVCGLLSKYLRWER